MSVNDLKVQLEVKGHEKLKECADNVIGAFIMVNEAVEELSGCMLELKISDPDVNENLVTEEPEMENKTPATKESFNAEAIMEDMILKSKGKFDECSLGREISGSFDREMLLSEEIRKLMGCLTMLKNTPETGVFKWGAEGYINIQGNQSMQVIEPVECYEIESLDQILQVAVDLTVDLVKRGSESYEDVFEKIKGLKRNYSWCVTEGMNDIKLRLLEKVKSEVEKELKQTQLPCVK